MNLAATHFFGADETQFESLSIAISEKEKEISMTNSKIVKSARYKTVRLLVNSKSLGKQISHKLLLYKIVYTFALEINFLSI